MAPRSMSRLAACALVLLLFGPSIAHGGQVRVDVGVAGPNGPTFSPYVVNINQGDHVIWVTTAGNHTVTNWTLPADSLGSSFDGTIFDSDAGGTHFGQGTTTRYSWKSDRTGDLPYVCVPHIPDMTGRVIVSPLTIPPTRPVADFRITEVQFNVAGGADLVEIANLGQAAGDLRSFRLTAIGTGTGVVISAGNFPVAAGARVTIHTGQTGTNTPTDIYLSAVGNLGDASGSVALYAPYSLSPGNALTNANMMLDFVQWGAGAQPNEATANLASFWTAGTSINGVAATHSIEYCANAALDHGVNRWAEIFPPNFGGNSDCTTPVLSHSWGRLKIIYRQ